MVAIGTHSDERLRVNQFDQTAGAAANGTTRILFNNIASQGNVKRPSASADVGLTYDLTEHRATSGWENAGIRTKMVRLRNNLTIVNRFLSFPFL
jgi:hypothetical protein